MLVLAGGWVFSLEKASNSASNLSAPVTYKVPVRRLHNSTIKGGYGIYDSGCGAMNLLVWRFSTVFTKIRRMNLILDHKEQTYS
ncbi:hypothetical protein O6P43_025899 [Quillaja saponaria]|uniref:Uncharacterized protein n=1 Tax=Quillaja saponaria TaxID=32244 RepID=A0AAD7LA78_QUISA|nr:hypothetical protein O6P43_025899 [Quillaja saponaria]